MTHDVFFICYDESNQDKNWQRVLEFHPDATKVRVKGISEAHMLCNALADTERFWTVDADNWLLQPLKFSTNIDVDLVFFNAKDGIDGTLSTIGGVKLWKKDSIVNPNMSKGDFSKNATRTSNTCMDLLSIHEYNSTPYETWRHSFRHNVKVLSGIIPKEAMIANQKRVERHKHLDINSYRGYLDAKEYVKECAGDFDKLKLINNYDWLKLKCPKEMQSPIC